MKGRKPSPATILDQDTAKISEEDLETRKAIERKLNSSSILKCPSKKKISSEARRVWKRIMKLFDGTDAVDILSDLDEVALTMYCEAVGIYETAHREWLKIQRVMVANPSTQGQIDRLLDRMNKQTRVINNLAEQLCLTPVGRARMGVASVTITKVSNPITEMFDSKKEPTA